ncbi:MAG: hypothetical protein DGJ47_000183 [Rickettsiaceae bacterium]
MPIQKYKTKVIAKPSAKLSGPELAASMRLAAIEALKQKNLDLPDDLLYEVIESDDIRSFKSFYNHKPFKEAVDFDLDIEGFTSHAVNYNSAEISKFLIQEIPTSGLPDTKTKKQFISELMLLSTITHSDKVIEHLFEHEYDPNLIIITGMNYCSILSGLLSNSELSLFNKLITHKDFNLHTKYSRYVSDLIMNSDCSQNYKVEKISELISSGLYVDLFKLGQKDTSFLKELLPSCVNQPHLIVRNYSALKSFTEEEFFNNYESFKELAKYKLVDAKAIVNVLIWDKAVSTQIVNGKIVSKPNIIQQSNIVPELNLMEYKDQQGVTVLDNLLKRISESHTAPNDPALILLKELLLQEESVQDFLREQPLSNETPQLLKVYTDQLPEAQRIDLLGNETVQAEMQAE